MFVYAIMRNAYLAGTLIAITCGVIGVFVVARNLSFLAHTMSEIGFSGAAFGVFAGLSPLNGMLLFTIVSSLVIGQLGVKQSRRESSISAVSSLFLGLGILFLSLANQSSGYATSILFGSIVGISAAEVQQVLLLAGFVMISVLMIFRPLSFDSYDPIGARSQGLKTEWLSMFFLFLMAITISIAAQIVGSLLVFILLTLPPAVAKFWGKTVWQLMLIAIGLSLIGVWGGLWLGYITNWPVTFFIASIECVFYFGTLAIKHFKD